MTSESLKKRLGFGIATLSRDRGSARLFSDVATWDARDRTSSHQWQARALERLGLGIATLRAIERARLFSDVATLACSGPSAFSPIASARVLERLGLGIATLRVMELCDIIQQRSHVGMLGTECLLTNGKRALVERFGLGIATLRPIDRCADCSATWPRWDARDRAPSHQWQANALEAARPLDSGLAPDRSMRRCSAT